MKLIYCQVCGDIFNLSFETKTCSCRSSSGFYSDTVNAEYSGPCVPIGFDNFSFLPAIISRPKSGKGLVFNAFVIPEECETFKKV